MTASTLTYSRVIERCLNLFTLLVILTKFRKRLNEMEIRGTDISFPGEFAFEFFEEVGVSFKAARRMIATCEAATALLMQGS